MLDLLAHDGATTEDLLAPPAATMDGIDILHSYSFNQQLMLPQGLELQQGVHSPEQASLGLDNTNNVSLSASDAVAAFLSMGQSSQQGLVHSRSMTRLVPTPAQAPATSIQLLAAASAANALPTSSRALAPQGVHFSSLPGSPRAVMSASPGHKRSASTTTTASDAIPAEELAEGSPEPQLPLPGIASKATSTASDLVPTTHYQSGSSAGSKLLTLLQQSRDSAGAEGGRGRRRTAAAAGSQQATASGTGGKGTPGNVSVISGSGRGGAIFPSGAELLGNSPDTYVAADPLQQLLDTALQQEQQQDHQQFLAQQRQKHNKAQSSNMLDFLYDNLLGLPGTATPATMAGAPSSSGRQASRPPKPVSHAMQRFIAGADSGASQQQDRESMDWAAEAVSGGSAGAGEDDDLADAYEGNRGTSSDGRGEGLERLKRSSRKRTRTVKAVEAEEEQALLAATGIKRRTNGAANRTNGINAARIYTQQHLKQHASYHLPPIQVQRPPQQRPTSARQQQRQQQPQQQPQAQSVLQQLQQAAEDMINSSSYLGNSNLLGSYAAYGEMPVDEFLHAEPHEGGLSAAAAAAAAVAGFRPVTPGVGDTEGGASAAGSMQLQGAAADGDREFMDDAQNDLLAAAYQALSAGAAAAAHWMPQEGSRTAAAAAAAVGASGRVSSRKARRSMSPATALAALASSGGWGAGNMAGGPAAAAAAAAATSGMFDCVDQDTAAGLELAAAAAAAGLGSSKGSGDAAAAAAAGYAPLPPAPPPKQQKQHKPRAAAAALAAAGSSGTRKAPRAKGGRKGGGRSAGRARCSDPETSAALAALTALANAAEGVSRFVGDHAKDQDAAAAAAAAGDVGPGAAAWTTVGGGGKNAKIVETGQLGGEEEGSRAARGPRAASRFIGVTWRERIQRWEVYVWASSSKRSHYIGAFPTSVHAARAYDVAVLWLMGQDARPRTRLNFPLSDYNLEEIQAEASAVAAMRQLGTHMTSAQRGQAAAQAAQAAAKQAAATVSGSGAFRTRGSNSSGAAAAAVVVDASAAAEIDDAAGGVGDGGHAAAAAAAVVGSVGIQIPTRPSSRCSRGQGSTGVPPAVVAEASAAEAEVAAFMVANAVAAAAELAPTVTDEVQYEDHGEREVTAALKALEAAEGASPLPASGGGGGVPAAAGSGDAAETAGEDVLLPGGSATAAAAEAAGGLMQMHRSSSRQQLLMATSLGSSPAATPQQQHQQRVSLNDAGRFDAMVEQKQQQQRRQQQQQSEGEGSLERTIRDSMAYGALDLLQHAAELEALNHELDGTTAAAAGSEDDGNEATSDDPAPATAAAAGARQQ